MARATQNQFKSMKKVKLLTLFAVLVCAMGAWAWTGSGTAADPYLIASVADWKTLASSSVTNTYSGTYFRLTEDILVNKMVGTDDSRFAGIFDGDGHTLTVSIISDGNQGAAPFNYISGATIKNLVVTGTVEETAYHTSGLVGFAEGGINTIENCRVSVNLNIGLLGAGLVGHGKSSTVNITGCVYNGTITSSTTDRNSNRAVGGLYGWCDNNAGIHITNSVFAGNIVFTDAVNHFNPIAIKNPGANNVDVTVSNSYYFCSFTPDNNTDASTAAKRAYSVSGEEGITVEIPGATTVYSVSGITMYSKGMLYNNALYGGAGENLSLTLTGADFYDATSGSLTGTANPYTLTMAEADCEIVQTVAKVKVNTTPYSSLAAAVAEWSNGTTLTLLADVTYYGRITINNTRTLDLNGHGIKETGDYELFCIDGGNLTLNDSDPTTTHKFALDENGVATLDEANGTFVLNGGYITGGRGNNTENGGIARNGHDGGAFFLTNATFTMNGGTIIGNSTNRHAGGVFICKSSLFTMNGGAITHNTANFGGAVAVYNSNSDIPDNSASTMVMNGGEIAYNYSTGHSGAIAINSANGANTVSIHGGSIVNNHVPEEKHSGAICIEHNNTIFNLSGNPVIKDNYVGSAQHSIYLTNNAKFRFDGDLINTEPIHVYMVNPDVPFTTGLGTHAVASNFVSDNPTYGVKINSTGEAIMTQAADIKTHPSAINTTYTGVAQTLVTAGEAINGTISYSLDRTSWSGSLPQATNAGTYTVYYRVVGDDTHGDIVPNPNSVDVTIAKAAPTVTTPASVGDLEYNGANQQLVTPGTSEHGEWQLCRNTVKCYC